METLKINVSTTFKDICNVPWVTIKRGGYDNLYGPTYATQPLDLEGISLDAGYASV